MFVNQSREQDKITSKTTNDIIIFSSEAWVPFSQRTQSLSLEFAKRGHRVFFIEPMLSLSRIVISIARRETLKLQSVHTKNIILLRPFIALTTFRGSVTRRFDKVMFRIWFKHIRNRFNISGRAIIYINLPYWWDNIIDRTTFPGNKIIYDCIDDCRVYSRNARILRVMERSEERLSNEADMVLATSKPLRDKISYYNDHVILMSNGVDSEKFIKRKYDIPDDIRSLKRPRIGFIGALYHWIDFPVFEKIASSRKEANVILVGPTNSDEIYLLARRYENIHYLGSKPYDLVPDYVQSFDVCLNPFKLDNIGQFVNPLKLYEYLILGKPVVSSRTKEMINYHEYVYLYNDYKELDSCLEKALNENQYAEMKKRISFAESNSWRAKVDRIFELLA